MGKIDEKLKKRLIKLWKDPTFKGSFSGINAFQSSLYLELGIEVSKKHIQETFESIPQWSMSLIRRRRFKRRKYFAFGSKER